MNLREELLAQAAGLALQAEAAEVVAAHFEPAYIKAMEEWLANKKDIAGSSNFWLLRQYVLDKKHEAQRVRLEEHQLRKAVELLPSEM